MHQKFIKNEFKKRQIKETFEQNSFIFLVQLKTIYLKKELLNKSKTFNIEFYKPSSSFLKKFIQSKFKKKFYKFCVTNVVSVFSGFSYLSINKFLNFLTYLQKDTTSNFLISFFFFKPISFKTFLIFCKLIPFKKNLTSKKINNLLLVKTFCRLSTCSTFFKLNRTS
uniref:Uncharacterized protein n=1 Tax=Chattonella marina TaxID=90936 RepID=D2Z216_9STRA|nr:hypothetical protein [Chattonella marina]BAI70580.1 hypothetical protein [Chattonella marina]